MTGFPLPDEMKEPIKETLSDEETEALMEETRLELEHQKQRKDKTMTKDKQSKSGVSQHKRLAMGEKIELKTGGKVGKSKAKKK